MNENLWFQDNCLDGNINNNDNNNDNNNNYKNCSLITYLLYNIDQLLWHILYTVSA